MILKKKKKKKMKSHVFIGHYLTSKYGRRPQDRFMLNDARLERKKSYISNKFSNMIFIMILVI